MTTPLRMDPDESKRLHLAAFRVRRLGYGPVGEMAAKEFSACAEFGYRIGTGALLHQAVEHVMAEWEKLQERIAERTYS